MIQDRLSILLNAQSESKMALMEQNTFGDMVKTARERRGLRSFELAALMGKQPSLISRIETGAIKDTPPPDVLAALSEHLGLDESEMLRALGYLHQMKSASVVKRGPITIADQIVECVRAVNWEAFPGLATGILKTLSGIVEDQQKLRRRDSGR